MKNNHWIPALFLAVLAFAACKPDAQKKDFVVKGKLEGLAGKSVVLEQFDPEGNHLVDSVQASADGTFEFSGYNPDNQLFLIRLPHNGQGIFCFPEKNTIELEGNSSQLMVAKWKDSWQSAAIARFQEERVILRQEFVKASNALRVISKETELERWMAQEKDADAAMVAYRDYLMGFMDTVSEPRLAAFAGLHLNVEGNFHYLNKFLNTHRDQLSKDASFKFLDMNVQEHGRQFMAFQATDFEGKTLAGEDFQLKQLLGKPVYLYIWASYCGLSRAENQRLNAFHKAFPDSDIQVLAFSIDKDENAWKQAVEADSINWAIHMRGEYEWNSPQIRQFKVESIPTSFLLDTKNIIRSKNAHGKDLLNFHEELLEMLSK